MIITITITAYYSINNNTWLVNAHSFNQGHRDTRHCSTCRHPLSKGIVAWLWRHPQNLSFRKTTSNKKTQPDEPLKNHCCLTKSKEVWAMALIPPLNPSMHIVVKPKVAARASPEAAPATKSVSPERAWWRQVSELHKQGHKTKGHRLFCKEFLCFNSNTVPCRRTPLLVHFSRWGHRRLPLRE